MVRVGDSRVAAAAAAAAAVAVAVVVVAAVEEAGPLDRRRLEAGLEALARERAERQAARRPGEKGRAAARPIAQGNR